MKMSEVKVGMKLYDPRRPHTPMIEVTEITRDGFCYKHEYRAMKSGHPDTDPQSGIFDGGEHYGYGGECWYEPVIAQ